MSNVDFGVVFRLAQAAAEQAFDAAKPVPMAVQRAEGLSDGFDWSKPYEVVSEGVCGFAWVNVYVDGRSKSAKVMKQFGAEKDYYGGLQFWSSVVAPSSRSSQSMQRMEAACKAFASVLRDYGYRAYASSRLD